MTITQSDAFMKKQIEELKEQVEFNSFINIRLNYKNASNEIQDPKKIENYETLTRFFFEELFA